MRSGHRFAARLFPANDVLFPGADPSSHSSIDDRTGASNHGLMSATSSPPVRPIELAVEAPFRLRSLEVTPAARELRRGPDVITLEPRVMQVLVALRRAEGRVVSREELLELCWEGRFVGDDSLNRSVSQLRKALAGEPEVAVDTIPRVGYRLRFDAGEVDDPAPVETSPPHRTLSRRVKILATVGGVLAACGVVAAIAPMLSPSKPWSASGVRPLTQEAGVQMFPAIAPDGLSVAYSAGKGFWEQRDIYLRNVSVGEATPIRLTETPEADELAPAWSPLGDRLAFLREHADGSCSIMLMTPPNGAERNVGTCSEPYAGLAWLNANELIVGHRPAGARARRLIVVDVNSGQARPLTNPPASTLGDSAPAVAAGGRWMAFRRTAAMGSDAIFLLDLHSGKSRALTDGGWKAAGFTWANDERTLFFSSNRGGDFGLWAIDAPTGTEPRRVTLGMLPLGRLSVDRQSRRIAVETGRMQSNLARVPAAGGASSLVTSGEGIDWDPDVRADGLILFASDRNGTNQIWARRPDGQIVRLTEMNASYVYAPRWSFDGGQIAFIAVVDGRTDLFTLRPDGSSLIRRTSDGAPKGRAIWSPDGTGIFFTAVSGSGWHLKRLDLRSGESTIVPGSSGIAIIERTGGRLLGRRASNGSIVAIDPQTGAIAALPVPIDVEGLEAWSPRSDGIVHVRGGGATAELWLTTWTGEARRLGAVRQPPRVPFAIAPDGAIITPQLLADDRKLMLIELD